MSRARSLGLFGVIAGFAIAIALASAPASAQPACGPEPAVATAVHTYGLGLFSQGQVDAACLCFDHALTLEVRAATQLAAARCHEEQKKFLQSHDEYRRAAELADGSGRQDVKTVALEGAVRVEAELGRIKLVVPPGWRGSITIGDREVPPDRYAEVRAVAPETDVRVVFQPSGVVQVVRATKGGLVEVHAPDGAVPPPAQPPRPPDAGRAVAPEPDAGLAPLTIAGITIGAAGVVALGVSLGLGVAAHDKRQDSDARCDLRAEPVTCDDEGLDLFEEGKSLALGSDVLLGVGLGLAVTGGVLAIVGLTLPADAKSARITPLLGPSGGGVAVQARF